MRLRPGPSGWTVAFPAGQGAGGGRRQVAPWDPGSRPPALPVLMALLASPSLARGWGQQASGRLGEHRPSRPAWPALGLSVQARRECVAAAHGAQPAAGAQTVTTPPPSPGPRLVFNRVNGRRPPATASSLEGTQETYTLAHEENVRFVSEAWRQVEQQLDAGQAGERGPGPVRYEERTPDARLQTGPQGLLRPRPLRDCRRLQGVRPWATARRLRTSSLCLDPGSLPLPCRWGQVLASRPAAAPAAITGGGWPGLGPAKRPAPHRAFPGLQSHRMQVGTGAVTPPARVPTVEASGQSRWALRAGPELTLGRRPRLPPPRQWTSSRSAGTCVSPWNCQGRRNNGKVKLTGAKGVAEDCASRWAGLSAQRPSEALAPRPGAAVLLGSPGGSWTGAAPSGAPWPQPTPGGQSVLWTPGRLPPAGR
ncbi:PREDICTED: protein FAM195A [Condylura cristata]|uniref:protein FAM195A n=1 Tax=Condylura cristata TaxID=143302 RepID=UPI0006430E40|nr:PREDICTED: protein FAM195A [Condylura cristata]